MDRNKYVVQCRKVMGVVALRKESVDRNKNFKPEVRDWFKSLSARRAWIEIMLLLAACMKVIGRSPQGERG